MKRPSGRHPLEIKALVKSYDGVQVIPPFTASVARGEKIAVMGRNGAGKTTLLKSLIRNAAGEIDDAEKQFAIDGGTVLWGHEVAVGYFAQDHTDSIVKGTTTIEWLHQFDPQASQEELRGLLGQMLFSGDDALKPTRALSGGEAARLIFCRLMLQKPNVLVLDEPTNHLDLESINALNFALQKFHGDGVPGHARSRRNRRSGDAHLASRWRPHRRFQGSVRRVSGVCGRAGVVVKFDKHRGLSYLAAF